MAGNPPPEGVTEEDYEAIHAAVVETVRGRWFLEEFARRVRTGEMDKVLTAIGRLENTILSQKALPDVPPHMRLLAQRAGEISGRLEQIVEDLRWSGAEERLCEELEAQARALAGLPKPGAAEPVSSVMEAAPVPSIATAPVVLQIEAQSAEAEDLEAETVSIGGEAAEADRLDAIPDEFASAEISALSQAEPEALYEEEGIPDEWVEEASPPEDLLLAGPSFEEAETASASPEDEPEAVAAEAVDAMVSMEASEEQQENVEDEPAEFVALSKALETELDLEAEELPGGPRLAALAAIDRLPLREKLALFG